MSELRLTNTLGGKLEAFEPLEDDHVRMYTCGLTVYNRGHIGNFRTFVSQDVLRRYLKYKGYRVTQVTNFTDVDDKTIDGARAAGMGLREYTQKFIDYFFEDCATLNIERAEHYPRATDPEYIEAMVELVRKLEERGHTYRGDGSIYFKVDSFPEYGKLSRIDVTGMKAGARVDSDEYTKENVRDFVLWKGPKDDEPSWDTAIGPGRPGWHLECSAMGMKLLGETFDLHSGGVDLDFPPPRERDRPERGCDGKAVRAALDAYGVPPRRGGENVEVEGEPVHGERARGRGLLPDGDAVSAPLRLLPAAAQLHPRGSAPGGDRDPAGRRPPRPAFGSEPRRGRPPRRPRRRPLELSPASKKRWTRI